MATYAPRIADGTVLHGIVRDHLETFLAEVAARTDGVGLPAFVEREFRGFLRPPDRRPAAPATARRPVRLELIRPR